MYMCFLSVFDPEAKIDGGIGSLRRHIMHNRLFGSLNHVATLYLKSIPDI